MLAQGTFRSDVSSRSELYHTSGQNLFEELALSVKKISSTNFLIQAGKYMYVSEVCDLKCEIIALYS